MAGYGRRHVVGSVPIKMGCGPASAPPLVLRRLISGLWRPRMRVYSSARQAKVSSCRIKIDSRTFHGSSSSRRWQMKARSCYAGVRWPTRPAWTPIGFRRVRHWMTVCGRHGRRSGRWPFTDSRLEHTSCACRRRARRGYTRTSLPSLSLPCSPHSTVVRCSICQWELWDWQSCFCRWY